jgi:hypothetical protein
LKTLKLSAPSSKAPPATSNQGRRKMSKKSNPSDNVLSLKEALDLANEQIEELASRVAEIQRECIEKQAILDAITRLIDY